MAKVINEDEVEEMKFSNVFVKELLVNEVPSITIAKIKLSGENEKCKNIRSHTYYYILEGEGTFTIDGENFPVKKGNLVCIPKNSIYQDSGNLIMLSIAIPKFNPDKVEIVK
ncbi:Cupin domain protein [uncultured archaeon]|nr:Cupin domain protein [uncultured archaeon]